MKPSFSVIRKDGKTDFVYECDFSKGIFNGGAAIYGYEDIDTFNLPSNMVEGLYLTAKQSKTTRKRA